jgi:hypothetical protein
VPPHSSPDLQLQAAGVGLAAVGLGEPAKARRFAELLGFPLDLLYAGGCWQHVSLVAGGGGVELADFSQSSWLHHQPWKSQKVTVTMRLPALRRICRDMVSHQSLSS